MNGVVRPTVSLCEVEHDCRAICLIVYILSQRLCYAPFDPVGSLQLPLRVAESDRGQTKLMTGVRRATPAAMAKERSLEGYAMKRLTLIAGMASVATVAAVMWSVPASATAMCGSNACAAVHNRWPGRPVANNNQQTRQTSPTSVPEPGVLPMLALGLGGVGFLALRRRRAKV